MKNKFKKIAVNITFLLMPWLAFAATYEDLKSAVIEKNAVTVERLIRNGMDPNVSYENGNTPLHLAVFEDAVAVFNLLIKIPRLKIDQKNAAGETPLMIAALRGNTAMVDSLLARGAQINKTGWTPLHYAASTGQNALVAKLLEKSAYIDAESPNKTTPLMMAARAGHASTVTLLLDQGADDSLKNEQNLAAADLAKKYDHQPVLAILHAKKTKQNLTANLQAPAIVSGLKSAKQTPAEWSPTSAVSQSRAEPVIAVPPIPESRNANTATTADKPWLR
jgi:ankyrin repeat protein